MCLILIGFQNKCSLFIILGAFYCIHKKNKEDFKLAINKRNVLNRHFITLNNISF